MSVDGGETQEEVGTGEGRDGDPGGERLIRAQSGVRGKETTFSHFPVETDYSRSSNTGHNPITRTSGHSKDAPRSKPTLRSSQILLISKFIMDRK